MSLCERGQACSCWFDGWFNVDWSLCCKKHDYQYMTDDGKGLSKLRVDKNLFDCVKHKGGYIMATVMFIGLNTIMLPFSLYYWYKYKGVRNGTTNNIS
jgi:hypothetical protein